MDKTFLLKTPATPQRLHDVVRDLDTYPDWIDFVDNVEAAATDDDAQPAWWVTLRAKLGPLARSKRLRMVKVVDNPPDDTGHGLVSFERQEVDGRQHASWTLTVHVEPGQEANSSQARCEMAYDGSLWLARLDPLVDQAAGQASRRLSVLVTQP